MINEQDPNRFYDKDPNRVHYDLATGKPVEQDVQYPERLASPNIDPATGRPYPTLAGGTPPQPTFTDPQNPGQPQAIDPNVGVGRPQQHNPAPPFGGYGLPQRDYQAPAVKGVAPRVHVYEITYHIAYGRHVRPLGQPGPLAFDPNTGRPVNQPAMGDPSHPTPNDPNRPWPNPNDPNRPGPPQPWPQQHESNRYDPQTGKEVPYVGKAGDRVEFIQNGPPEKELVVAVDQASAIAALPKQDAPHSIIVESVTNVSSRSALLATDVRTGRPSEIDSTSDRDLDAHGLRGNRGAGWRAGSAPKLKSLRGA